MNPITQFVDLFYNVAMLSLSVVMQLLWPITFQLGRGERMIESTQFHLTPGLDGNQSQQNLVKDPYYDQGYHATHHHQLIEDSEYYKARAELALNYWNPSEIGLRIFDYGCGLGQSIALLANAEGWDVSSEARDFCRTKCLMVHDSMDLVPRQAYNRVLCRHVLEHLEKPFDDLRLIRELLRCDGELLLILPIELHFIPNDGYKPDINQHLYCWTPRTIANLLWRAKFRPISVKYQYPFGWHGLLPVRRFAGIWAYHTAIRLGGQLFRRNGEMVIRAKLAV